MTQATISIDCKVGYSSERLQQGALAALAEGCDMVLAELGPYAQRVEVIKITPSVAYGGAVYVNAKAKMVIAGTDGLPKLEILVSDVPIGDIRKPLTVPEQTAVALELGNRLVNETKQVLKRALSNTKTQTTRLQEFLTELG